MLTKEQRAKRDTIFSPWGIKAWRHPSDSTKDSIIVFESFEWNESAGDHPEIMRVIGNENDPVFQVLQEVVEKHNELIPGHAVYSYGRTPREAIESYAKKHGWGKITLGENLDGGDGYDWGFRFQIEDTTGMKCAGVNVTGGTTMTWWK